MVSSFVFKIPLLGLERKVWNLDVQFFWLDWSTRDMLLGWTSDGIAQGCCSMEWCKVSNVFSFSIRLTLGIGELIILANSYSSTVNSSMSKDISKIVKSSFGNESLMGNLLASRLWYFFFPMWIPIVINCSSSVSSFSSRSKVAFFLASKLDTWFRILWSSIHSSYILSVQFWVFWRTLIVLSSSNRSPSSFATRRFGVYSLDLSHNVCVWQSPCFEKNLVI